GLTALWFAGAFRDKALKIVGDGNNRWTMIHADDLAEGYVRLVESGLHGEVFNFTDRSRFTVGEMARAAADAAGYTGSIGLIPVEEAAQTMGDMAECLALDQHVDSRKAVRRLGWQPRFGGFADDAATYFEAWRAHHS
ncbi:MAG TPA: NAD-dependent epimerase/dehydratase family protein, partial [Acidobacteriota bacterium]|nr:NAD-dependent epimerase/dehydratase family protein [Acidobacteriota bacterium]